MSVSVTVVRTVSLEGPAIARRAGEGSQFLSGGAAGRATKFNVIKQYRDDVYCPTHGCTWERVYKFRVGDLAQDAASVAALDDMERWYTDSKYGDAEFVAPDTPHGHTLSIRASPSRN